MAAASFLNHEAFPVIAHLERESSRSAGGAIYLASGLDSRIYQLSGGHERMLYDAAEVEKRPPQIRCVRSLPGSPYLYFSVVPTPQNTAPLSDGTIYALNLCANRVDYSIPVSQATIGRDWWGAFLPDVDSPSDLHRQLSRARFSRHSRVRILHSAPNPDARQAGDAPPRKANLAGRVVAPGTSYSMPGEHIQYNTRRFRRLAGASAETWT